MTDISIVPDSQFTEVSAGGVHTCGINTDGFIECWGEPLYDQLDAPEGQFSGLSAGGLHTCGLGTDGSVHCWGGKTYGQVYPLSADLMGETQVTGEYTNLAENHAGIYKLQRFGPTVTGYFSATRSPVKYFAQQHPETLFTIPEGFRPALDIVWEVEGWPVLNDGTLDPLNSEPRPFSLEASTDGTVRYVHNEQIEGAGLLWYSTRMAWPHAAADPKVCNRSSDVRWGILLALARQGFESMDCAEVGWAQLADIRELGGKSENSRGTVRLFLKDPYDLAGLQRLETVNLILDYSIPEQLLAPTPNLRSLAVEGGYLHGDYFFHSRHLPKLPADLLHYTPRLTSLALNTYTLANLPQDFLSTVPHLTSLTLLYMFKAEPTDSWFDVQPIPENLLSHTPKLESLVLYAFQQPDLPRTLLHPVPELTTLSLWGPYLSTLPIGFLSAVPQLNTLRLYLADDFFGTQLDSLPEDFLSDAPQLIELTINAPSLTSLPPNFLSNAPSLTDLQADLPGLTPESEQFIEDLKPVLVENWNNKVNSISGPFVAASPGSIGICVLNTSGTISCWDTRGQTNSPGGKYISVHASLHEDFACGLRTDMTIHCWGSNQFGQTVAPSGHFSELAIGAQHVCGIRTVGSVTCWGSTDQMEPPSEKLRSLSTYGFTTCGIGVRGFVRCWGGSFIREVELGNMQVRKVSVGSRHVCGITADGRIQCKGSNSYGQTDVPEEVFSDLSAAGDHTCGLKIDGTVQCWGANWDGQLDVPPGRFRSVYTGIDKTCGIAPDGRLVCWGRISNVPVFRG